MAAPAPPPDGHPVIETTRGPVRVGVRAYARRGGRGLRYQPAESVWLGFDDADPERSRPVLAASRSVAFEVWVPEGFPDDPSVYLGRDTTAWDDGLHVRLAYRDTRAEGGRTWDVYWAAPDDDDVKTVRNEHWCAARARATVCAGPRRPLRHPDGRPLATTVDLGYDGDYGEVYERVLRALSEGSLPGHLAAPFERYMGFARREDGEALAYSLYKRLRAVTDDFERALRSVLARPDTTLAPTLRHYDLGPGEAVRHLTEHAGRAAVVAVGRAGRVGGRAVPTAFTVATPRETAETAANAYAGWAVRRVARAAEFVRRHLEREEAMAPEPVPQHADALRWLDRTRTRFRRHQHRLPVQARAPAGSAAVYYDPRYASLRRLSDTLDYVLGHVDGDEVPFEVQAFWQLYERWCFLEVLRALQALGFRFVRDGHRASEFYRHPVPGQVNGELSHPDLPDTTLEVWFDKEYPAVWKGTDYYDPARPYGLDKRLDRNPYTGRKRRPDIALEFHTGPGRSSPAIVTLDPTLQAQRRGAGPSDAPERKYEYLDGLRSFVETDASGYARPLVRAAWGVSPVRTGGGHTLDSDGDPRRGFVHLRPGHDAERSMTDALGLILRGVGLLPDRREVSP